MNTGPINSDGNNSYSIIEKAGYERIVVCDDAESGLYSIISVHSNRLGPGLGGCRFYPYVNREAALADVLNLSKAMTYKASVAGLPLGGGKAVIMGNPAKDKTEALWKRYAAFVDHLEGRYITTEDSGTATSDMDIVRKYSKHVTGSSTSGGGSGDPSPMTAFGVDYGIRACAKFLWGSEDLTGKRIAIQGVGHVGFSLAERLKKLHAELVVTDVNEAKLQRASKELGAEVVKPDEIFSVACDIFAPCALGGVVNEETLPQLKCKVVAGAANNQLASDEIAEGLHTRGILYAPDFAINAGGLISVAREVLGYGQEETETKSKEIYQTILDILTKASEAKVSPAKVAVEIAQARVEAGK